MLAHTVYFTLTDASPAACCKLVEACKRDLSSHPGTVFFAAGTRATDIDWSVSDRDFDVVLHLVFRDRATHDAYQESKQHQRFLEEHESNWSQIRVFDANVETSAP
jgi:hypothetical protein